MGIRNVRQNATSAATSITRIRLQSESGACQRTTICEQCYTHIFFLSKGLEQSNSVRVTQTGGLLKHHTGTSRHERRGNKIKDTVVFPCLELQVLKRPSSRTVRIAFRTLPRCSCFLSLADCCSCVLRRFVCGGFVFCFVFNLWQHTQPKTVVRGYDSKQEKREVWSGTKTPHDHIDTNRTRD